jgi:hypothetical protein
MTVSNEMANRHELRLLSVISGPRLQIRHVVGHAPGEWIRELKRRFA